MIALAVVGYLATGVVLVRVLASVIGDQEAVHFGGDGRPLAGALVVFWPLLVVALLAAALLWLVGFLAIGRQ